MDQEMINRLGDELYAAFVSRNTIKPFTERDLDITLEQAYHRAIRLSPKNPWWVPAGYGFALHLVGRKEEAVAALKRAIDQKSRNATARARLAAVYADLGRMNEAKAAAKEAKRLNPKFTASRYMKSYSLNDPKRDAWYTDLLLRAGLPE